MYPKIPKFRRVGQSGQYEVASLLSTFANVLFPDYDAGVDFYCELIENNMPSGKFFSVQAKTTNQFENYWSEPIEKKTITLWLAQPSPVFIVLLEKSTGNCYWASTEDNRNSWEIRLRDQRNTVDVKVDRSHILDRFGENLEFIEKIKNDLVLVNAVHGIPNMIGEGYVRAIPVLWLSDGARENVRYRIRLGFDYLINDSVLKSNLPDAYQLGKLLTAFDKGHYDHFLVLARICRQLAKPDEAKEYYKLAIEICKSDPNWNNRKKPSDPTIEEIIRNIERELSTLKSDKTN